jgi:hypothetical protein
MHYYFVFTNKLIGKASFVRLLASFFIAGNLQWKKVLLLQTTQILKLDINDFNLISGIPKFLMKIAFKPKFIDST